MERVGLPTLECRAEQSKDSHILDPVVSVFRCQGEVQKADMVELDVTDEF